MTKLEYLANLEYVKHMWEEAMPKEASQLTQELEKEISALREGMVI